MNNPQAFPLSGDWSQIKDKGMTLRDYFAAKAMQSWITVTVQRYVHKGELQIDMPSQNSIAKEAYEMADAMLKAREA
jgi:hypothetical protein